jgi:hypothetical protein
MGVKLYDGWDQFQFDDSGWDRSVEVQKLIAKEQFDRLVYLMHAVLQKYTPRDKLCEELLVKVVSSIKLETSNEITFKLNKWQFIDAAKSGNGVVPTIFWSVDLISDFVKSQTNLKISRALGDWARNSKKPPKIAEVTAEEVAATQIAEQISKTISEPEKGPRRDSLRTGQISPTPEKDIGSLRLSNIGSPTPEKHIKKSASIGNSTSKPDRKNSRNDTLNASVSEIMLDTELPPITGPLKLAPLAGSRTSVS